MIQLIIGPMFAGKSTKMCHIIERYKLANKKCIIVKHSFDNRYDSCTQIKNHNGVRLDTVPVIKTMKLSNICVDDIDVIGISESQFYDDLLIVVNWCNLGKIIICEGLDGDSNQQPFGQIYKLIPHCQKIKKLTAICKCGNKAIYTKRFCETTEIICIGGSEKYNAVCYRCL